MTNPIDREIVAGRVKQIRKTLNIKGKDFAARLNISGPSLSEIERGKYLPNFEFLHHMAKEFNVNVYFVLFGEGPMFADPGKHAEMSILEDLAGNSEDIRRFFYYFERSGIMRYYILSQFKSRLMMDKELIEKEIDDFKTENQQHSPIE